ncbi:MAG: GNAT family N-acetyltransferase [Eubacterium sp.]
MDKIVEITKYDDEIIALWQEAFGDSREDVLFFLESCKNKSCLCFYNNRLCSMLFLVDCKVNGVSFKYIYAACTGNACRKKGYMSKLLEYCQRNYGRAVLIPADENLADYYLKRKFNHKINVNDILFNECREIEEYLFEGCSLKEPFALAYEGE